MFPHDPHLHHILRTGMKRVLLSLLVVFFCLGSALDARAQYEVRKPAGTATQASITVTGPAAAVTWEKGQRCEVTWTSSGIRGSVIIDLVDPQGKVTPLVRQTLNNGNYSFTLMPNIPDGDYKIRISSIDRKTVGDSAGMVSVAPRSGTAVTRPGAVETPTSPSTTTYEPRTTAPVTTDTKSLPTTDIDQKTDLTVAPTGASPGELTEVDVVRREISAIQPTDLQIAYIESAVSATVMQDLSGVTNTLPATLGGVINVTAPAEDAEWVAGNKYPVQWVSGDLDGDVKIDLVRTTATDREIFPLVARTENDGAFDCLVPGNLGCKWWGFRVRVASVKTKAEAYSAGFTVYNEPVDMTCNIVNLKRKWEDGNYIVYFDHDEWLEFDVCLRNNGTQPSVNVPAVSVVIVKEPEEIVAYQEEWGFSNIYPRLWYMTPEPRKFDISSWWIGPFTPMFHEEDLKAGAYRVEVTVDPFNQLGEDPDLREDNKMIRRFVLK